MLFSYDASSLAVSTLPLSGDASSLDGSMHPTPDLIIPVLYLSASYPCYGTSNACYVQDIAVSILLYLCPQDVGCVAVSILPLF